MVEDLSQFLRDRLDEDAKAAEAAGDSWYGYEPEQQIAFVSVADAQHIARQSPARVLRQTAVLRNRVDLWSKMAGSHARACLRDLAAIWEDHPDYREEWRL